MTLHSFKVRSVLSALVLNPSGTPNPLRLYEMYIQLMFLFRVTSDLSASLLCG